MDEYATYGILSEWNTRESLTDDHWQDISELLRSIGEYGGAGPQRKALIRLSESEEIFVYSPTGDIYYLPKESLVLDFAYKIHSELGDYCAGALLNGEWVPPTHVLKDGDVVKILTSTDRYDADPGLEELCKTPKARTAINKHLQQKRLRYAQDIGRQILLQEIERHGLSADILENENTGFILEFNNIKDLPELFARVGQDLLSPHVVLYYFTNAPGKDKEKGQTDSRQFSSHAMNVLTISDLDRGIHKFARCCNPFPGQENVLAVLSERGITFHHKGCSDLLYRHDLQPQRLLDVRWDWNATWSHRLVFRFRIFRQTLPAVIRSLAFLRIDADMQTLLSAKDKYGAPLVMVTVILQSFGAAKEFFGCFPSAKISLDGYGREEGPQFSD